MQMVFARILPTDRDIIKQVVIVFMSVEISPCRARDFGRGGVLHTAI
jgi:hypothetical protein